MRQEPNISPEAAHRQRVQDIHDAQCEQKEVRAHKRRLRAQHEAEGRRPLRPRRDPRRVSLVTANVTAASSLVDELMHGSALRRDDFVLVQEIASAPEACEKLSKDLLSLGYSPTLQKSYFKQGGYGGGTAILAKGEGGVRPQPPSDFGGRCVYGVINIGVEVLCVSVYGISGAGVKAQMPLWTEIATRIRTLGKLFIIAGDWQVSPSEVARAKLDRHLGAVILAPPTPTNRVTGTTIDFFLVASELLGESSFAEAVEGCRFSPHAPVRVALQTDGRIPLIRKLSIPRLLPIDRPIGPQLPATTVEWDPWHERARTLGAVDLDAATLEWSAGAEIELLGLFGKLAKEDRAKFTGIGMKRKEIAATPSRSFRDVPDAVGIIGHRLNWTIRQLHFVVTHGPSLVRHGEAMVATFGREGAARRQAGRARDAARRRTSPTSTTGASLGDHLQHRDDPLPWQYDVAWRVACRAAAFLREVRPLSERPEDAEALRECNAGLRRIAALARASRGWPPLLDRWCRGDAAHNLEAFVDLRDRLERQYHQLVARRTSRRVRDCRRWAQQASLAIAHRVTKVLETTTAFSASASKSHLGAINPQEAADDGIVEWSGPWKAGQQDITDEIMRGVEAVEVMDRLHEDLVLPPFTDDRVFDGSRSFQGRTAVGLCGLRPRHLLLLSRAARRALCTVLSSIEAARRWPASLREVVEVALAKRAGGSRLIGLAPTLYRLWARIRYRDCRALLEDRIERPFLTAAPKRGAARAAFEAARTCEVAIARDQCAAASLFDVSRYYEFIEPAEYAASAARFGVPQVVVALATHLYLAPRRIRVKTAYSASVIPRRSVIAGCTWATVLIRLIVIPPAEALLRQIDRKFRDWGLRYHFNVYVDDVLAVTMGGGSAVALLHAWLTRLVVDWISKSLRKQVAIGKTQVLASSSWLKRSLRAQLGDLSQYVVGGGGRASRNGLRLWRALAAQAGFPQETPPGDAQKTETEMVEEARRCGSRDRQGRAGDECRSRCRGSRNSLLHSPRPSPCPSGQHDCQSERGVGHGEARTWWISFSRRRSSHYPGKPAATPDHQHAMGFPLCPC